MTRKRIGISDSFQLGDEALRQVAGSDASGNAFGLQLLEHPFHMVLGHGEPGSQGGRIDEEVPPLIQPRDQMMGYFEVDISVQFQAKLLIEALLEGPCLLGHGIRRRN